MLVFLELFALFTLGCTGLQDDVTVIRRRALNVGSGIWTLELRGRTNALGKPFFSPGDSELLEPNTGFNISHCNGWEPECDWNLTNWRRNAKTGDISVATTPDSFLPGKMMSSTGRRDSEYVNRLSGRITSPNFPNNYTETDSRMYVISTVKGYNINLSFTDFDLCNKTGSICSDKVRVFDGPNPYSKQLGIFCGNSLPPILRSSGYQMAIDLTVGASDDCKAPKGFSADFNTEMTDLTLTADEGSMTSPAVMFVESKICVTVTYLLEPGSSIDILAKLESGGTISIGQALSEEVGSNWRIQRFLTKILDKYLFETARVILKARRTGNGNVFIERIAGCNPDNDEDTYISDTYTPIPYRMLEHQVSDLEMRVQVKDEDDTIGCSNGGRYDAFYGQCVCPAGFTGTTCEVGCGPNRYGDDCGGICSMMVGGCLDITLMRRGIDAECAPGVQHDRKYDCKNECKGGYYGNNCNLKCGDCADGNCDIYTGRCKSDDCKDGYIAPTCQQKYKHFIDMPTFISSGFTSITCEVNMTSANMAGAGEPVYYQILYQVASSENWEAYLTLPIPKDADVIRSTLTGLTSGKLYSIRAVLIHADLGAYTEFQGPLHQMPTKCVVPEYVSFGIRTGTSGVGRITIDWNYEDVTATWCPESYVKVYLKGLGMPWVLNGVGKTGSTWYISSLLPDTEYYVKLRMVTIEGEVPLYSKATRVRTEYSKPGPVRNLRVVNVTSHTASLKWDTPTTTGIPTEYIVASTCKHISGCDPSQDCLHNANVMRVYETFVEIESLYAFTSYRIDVSAKERSGTSDSVSTYIVTDASAPEVSPKQTTHSFVNNTATSFDAYWGKPENDLLCKKLNGFMEGYHYNLTTMYTGVTVEVGDTTDKHSSFSNLEPDTHYQLHVYIRSTGGWNENYPIVMNGWTTN